MASVKVIHKMIDEAVIAAMPVSEPVNDWEIRRALQRQGTGETPKIKKLRLKFEKVREDYDTAQAAYQKAIDDEVTKAVEAPKKAIAAKLKSWEKLRDEAESLKVDVALDPKAAAPVKEFLAKCRKAKS